MSHKWPGDKGIREQVSKWVGEPVGEYADEQGSSCVGEQVIRFVIEKYPVINKGIGVTINCQ